MNGSESRDEPPVDVSSILPTAPATTDPGPSTDFESRKTVLRAERKDSVEITGIVNQYIETDLPSTLEVVERTETYYGPELLLTDGVRNYMITAPGPDTQLLLWGEIVNEQEYREKWVRIAEVRTSIDETPRYEFCDQCGSPIRSKEHERLSSIGRCPKVRS